MAIQLVCKEDSGYPQIKLVSPDMTEYVLTVLDGGILQTGGSSAAPVASVFGRTGVIVAATNDYTWAQIDKTISSLNDVTTKRIGDATNHTDWDVSGIQTMAGTARVKKSFSFYSYNIGGLAATYNGVSCGAAGLSSLNGFYFTSFDDGGGAGTAEAANFAFQLPNDYVDGTDIDIEFGMIVAGTSTNNVRWQCGETHVSETDTYSPSTYTWATPQNVAAPGTAWQRKIVKFTLSGTGMLKEDDVAVVVFRDADNASDNYVGDAYFPVVEVYYIADRLGGTI